MNSKSKWSFYIKFYPLLIMFVIIFMSIGYASINPIELGINGSATGLFQTYNDLYVSSATVSASSSETIDFNSINGLMFDTKVSLLKKSSSTATMVVTIVNPSQTSYRFNGVIYAKDLVSAQPNIYSNSDIVYSYSANKTEINPGETIKVTIKFSYKSYSSSVNPILNSILSIDFGKVKETVQNKVEGSNSVALYETTKSEEGLTFNGENSYAVFENTAKFPLTYSITFKTNIENGVLMGDYDTKAGFGFLGKRIVVNVGSSSSYTPEFIMNNSFQSGEWYTVDLLYESVTSQRLFINGVEVTTRGNRNYWVWGDSVSYIGVRPISNNYSTAYNFDGVLKRFLIYNKLLTEGEIIQNYNVSSSDDLIQDSLVTHFEFAD